MSFAKKNILLVEDEAIIALSEKQVLEKEGFRVFHASNGNKALEMIKSAEELVDLILMDIDLGEQRDGTEAIKEILSRTDIPLMFLSSHTEKEYVDKTEQFTSYGFIDKNSGYTVLLASIKMAFKLAESKKALKEKEKSLEESEKLLNESQALAHIGHWNWDILKSELIWSDEVFRIFGVERKKFAVSAENFERMIHPEDLKAFLTKRNEMLEKNFSSEIGHRIIRPSGETRYVVERSQVVRNSDDIAIRVFGTVQDITERIEQEKKLESVLEEKELLFKELKHRVKNSLNIVSSLLSIESEKINDKQIKKNLKSAKSKINSISKVYEFLENSDFQNKVDLKSCLRKIAELILKSFKSDKQEIELCCNFTDLRIDTKKAVSLSLILNELMTNALKYAFPDGRKGKIEIVLSKKGCHYEFSFSDDGIGTDLKVRSEDPECFGLKMIELLAIQLNGEFTINGSSKGTSARLTFSDNN